MSIVHNGKIIGSAILGNWVEAKTLQDGDHFVWNTDLWVIISHEDEAFLEVIRYAYVNKHADLIELRSDYESFKSNKDNCEKFNGYCDVREIKLSFDDAFATTGTSA